MSAKKNNGESSPQSPNKRLILNREKVKDINVRTGVKTGLSGSMGSSNSVPVASGGVSKV